MAVPSERKEGLKSYSILDEVAQILELPSDPVTVTRYKGAIIVDVDEMTFIYDDRDLSPVKTALVGKHVPDEVLGPTRARLNAEISLRSSELTLEQRGVLVDRITRQNNMLIANGRSDIANSRRLKNLPGVIRR